MRGGLRSALGVLALALQLACAHGTHHAPPYRDDLAAAASIEVAAVEWCRAMGEPAGRPARPFTTDGCSCWPDGAWRDCCVLHDIAYWCGGSPELRALADRELDRCVSEQESGALGSLMRGGVWLGGHPWWPTPWRWGYGHSFPASYYGLAEEGREESRPDANDPESLRP